MDRLLTGSQVITSVLNYLITVIPLILVKWNFNSDTPVYSFTLSFY